MKESERLAAETEREARTVKKLRAVGEKYRYDPQRAKGTHTQVYEYSLRGLWEGC